MGQVRASDGVALYVEAHGEGVPVVLSCGYATTHENFREQVAPIVEAGARVVLWDYRGHGRSGAPHDAGAYSMEQVLEDLGRVVAWGGGGEPAVLLGFSFGGLASLHFAIRHRERVRALVLLASGPGFKNPEAQARWIAQVERTAELLETRGFDGFLGGKAALTAVGRRPDLPAARRAAEAIRAQDPRAVALFGRRVAGPVPAAIDALASLDVPALVLIGEEDEAYRRAADVMAARLPRARRVEVPSAGHVASVEAPAAVNEALVTFLRELGIGAS